MRIRRFEGRPQDEISLITTPSSLECPHYPTLPEEQHVVKKGSNIDSALESSDMEADQINRLGGIHFAIDPSRCTGSSSMGQPPFAVINGDQHVTYASKVASTRKNVPEGNDISGSVEHEVLITAKDIIVNNTWTIPSIQLSDRMLDQVDHNM
ncbi:hypothetical protein V6N12_042503 [Hibiscus sabdariffa]|uniref:Uncharacterized protein n=1 Tax=Hibiscus sabdariffa TaxID=183260 RepID=A0ABR2EEY8_9ROSI